MGPAHRLGDDGIDDPEFEQILRGDLHIRRCVFGARGITPKNRGRSLRRRDGVDGVFEHQDAVAAGDRDGAAGAALTEDDGDARHSERQRHVGRPGDGFGLAALFSVNAGEGAGGIDKGHDRQDRTGRRAA